MKNIWWYLFVIGLVMERAGTDYHTGLWLATPLLIGVFMEIGLQSWEVRAKKRWYDSQKKSSVIKDVIHEYNKCALENNKNQ